MNFVKMAAFYADLRSFLSFPNRKNKMLREKLDIFSLDRKLEWAIMTLILTLAGTEH